MTPKLLLATFAICLSVTGFAQNVGIGNTNPSYPLDVTGDIRLRYSGSYTDIHFNNSADVLSTSFGHLTDSMLGIRNATTFQYPFRFDYKNSRLAIGSGPAPKYPIDIRGTDGVIAGFESTDPMALSSRVTLLIKNGSYYPAGWGTIGTSSNTADFGIFTSSDGQLINMFERLKITNLGDVGIGVGSAAPLARLHVMDNDSSIAIFSNSAAMATNAKSGIYLKQGTYYTAGIRTRATSINAANLSFFTYAGQNKGDLLERMTIEDGGNVGINVTDPTAKLDVDGSLRFRTGAATGEVLTSDAIGNATWQAAPGNTNFSSFISNDQVITNTFKTLRFQDEEYDNGNVFNDSIFTAPAAGIYHFDLLLYDIAGIGIAAGPTNYIEVEALGNLGLIRHVVSYFPNATNVMANSVTLSFDRQLNQGNTMKFAIKTNYTGGTTTVGSLSNSISCHRVQ